MKVYDKCLSSPLNIKDTEDMSEHIAIAHSVAGLMNGLDDNAEVDPIDIQNLGELLRALLSHPMEASTHLLHEKWAAAKKEEREAARKARIRKAKKKK